MLKIQDSRLRAVIVVACLAIAGPVAAYYAVGTLGSDQASCVQQHDCTVANAETDDAVTSAARRIAGQGPAAGLLADRRMVSDIAEVGALANGVKVYSFKYIFEDTVRVGVLAEDLMERADTKVAVLTMANGLLGVDYAALGLRMATLAQWDNAGVAALRSDFAPTVRRSAKVNPA